MDPYIGITDFMTAEQVNNTLGILTLHRHPNSKRKLHVGVMTSFKMMHCKQTRWREAFPCLRDIADIFVSTSPLVYHCLHYVDYEPNRMAADMDIAQAIQLGGPNLHALQLDMVWPGADTIVKALANTNKNVEVILQIGQNAFEQVGDNPQGVIDELRSYEGIIQRVLLDRSMGRGKAMDPDGLQPFVRAIQKQYPEIGITVAGGLGPDSLHLVVPLLESFPDLSIDAQSRLRPSANALDPIDWQMANDYLIKALQLFER